MYCGLVLIQFGEREPVKVCRWVLALEALRRSALSERPLHVPVLAAPIEAGKLPIDEGDDVGFRCAGAVIIT